MGSGWVSVDIYHLSSSACYQHASELWGAQERGGVEGARANQQPELEVSGQVFLLPGSLKGKGSAARKAKEMGGEGAAK